MKKRLNLLVGYGQGEGSSCGPNAMKYVISYKKGINISEKALMIIGGTSEQNGTSVEGMTKIADRFNLNYELKYDSSISDLIDSIDNENPVILLIQAWGDGHYVAAIGYNDLEEKIHYYDPFDGKKKDIHYKKLEKKWHDSDSKKNYNRFGIFFKN